MSNYFEKVLLASRTETATGSEAGSVSTQSRRFSGEGGLRLYLEVSNAAGTSPTLDVTVIGVVNGIRYVLGVFTQLTTTGETLSIFIDGAPDDISFDWVITGSAGQTFTFNIGGSRAGR